MAAPVRMVPSFDELYEEIARLPTGMTGEILEPGVIRTMSRPGRRHGRAVKLCSAALRDYDVETGGKGWWILIEPEIKLPGPRLVVPDICGFRLERVPELPEDNPIAITPDFVCEVLSPRTAREDRMVKLPIYAGSGVQTVWLVDTAMRTLDVFETRDRRPSRVMTARDEDCMVLPPFPGGPIAVGDFWMRSQGEG
jgi:Uma2 family endonuclease